MTIKQALMRILTLALGCALAYVIGFTVPVAFADRTQHHVTLHGAKA